MSGSAYAKIRRDLIIIAISAVAAIVLARTGAMHTVLFSMREYAHAESFVVGLFFTSAFTTIPAITAFGEIAAEGSNILTVAFFGAIGAVLGDLLIFRFVRHRLFDDLLHLISRNKQDRFLHIIHQRLFRWLTPLVAAVIIASPLPDELAIAVLGSSTIRTIFFVPFSFTANFFGILIICLLAQQIL